MQKIDKARFAKDVRATEFGPAPQLVWLPIEKLVVDETYQRPIGRTGEKTVRAIIANFDWTKFAPVIVSPIEGGLYAIVDGQHRTTGAAAVGLEQVPCQVILADRRTQAMAFNAINGNVTQVSRSQQFKAALVAEDETAKRIRAVAEAAGVTILFNHTQSSQMKPGQTIALDAICRAVFKTGDDVTKAALKAILASSGDLGGYLRAPIITAVVDVLAVHPAWTVDPRLHEAFEKIELEEAWRETKSVAAGRRGVRGGDLLKAEIAKHLAKHLDRGERR